MNVGGDEVPEDAWGKGSPICAKLKKENGIKTTPEMQAYFLLKLQGILAKYKFKLAAWDEAAETDKLDKNTTIITSWSSVDAGKTVAAKGYKVVMAPANYLYFDLAYDSDVTEPGYYWAGYIDEKRIYSYIPTAKDMPKPICNNIIGIQGCLWGDTLVHPRLSMREKFPANYLDSPVEYMGLPKMTALSETAWTPDSKRSWKSFKKRLESNKKILENFDIAHR